MSSAGAGARKRKQEPLSIADLEQKIAKLRRQEAVVTRHLNRLGAQHQRAAPPAVAPSSPPAPALDPYDARVAELRDNQAKRLRAFWNDVRKEVRKLLKMGLVNQWFGIPVRESAWGQDARNWASYCQKVSRPMDLSTIRDRLGETDAENRYAQPEQVTADVRLIVSNCEVFNVGDSGDPVRKVSRTLQATWERRWQPTDATGLAFRWQEIQECTKAENQVLADLEAMTPAARAHNLATLDSCLVRQRVQLLPATKAPPPPPPSAFPWDAKRKLAIALSNLNMDHSYGVIEILQSCGALGAEGEGELRVDLDAIPNPALQKLATYVEGVYAQAKRDPKSKSKPQPQGSRADAQPTASAMQSAHASDAAAASDEAAALVDTAAAASRPASAAGGATDVPMRPRSGASTAPLNPSPLASASCTAAPRAQTPHSPAAIPQGAATHVLQEGAADGGAAAAPLERQSQSGAAPLVTEIAAGQLRSEARDPGGGAGPHWEATGHVAQVGQALHRASAGATGAGVLHSPLGHSKSGGAEPGRQNGTGVGGIAAKQQQPPAGVQASQQPPAQWPDGSVAAGR